jgi:hypothetical protein
MKLFMLIKMEPMVRSRPTGKHLSDAFTIQNGLKHGDAVSPLLFIFVLEYAEAVLDAQRKVGLEVNAAKTKLCSCLITRL